MSWSGNSDLLNNNSFRNYMYEDKVFILDEITSENCAYLIGDLSNYVLKEENKDKSITFILNSPGGEYDVMLNIIGFINLAKLNNIQVETIVMGSVASAASLIAVQGDVRYMTKYAHHLVHFGCFPAIIHQSTEIDKIQTQAKQFETDKDELYIAASGGKLTKSKLKALQEDERGYVTATDCIKYGLADVIIEDSLNEKLKHDQYSLEYGQGYEKFVKDKEKKVITEIIKPKKAHKTKAKK